LIAEVGVGRDRVDLDAELLEGVVVVGEVLELGRTHEREVGGIEHEHAPLAPDRLVRDGHELALVVGGRLERFDRRVDDRHAVLLGRLAAGSILAARPFCAFSLAKSNRTFLTCVH
jgi:hypothetical protein